MEVGQPPRDAEQDVATPPVPTQLPPPAALALQHVALQRAAQIAARHVLPDALQAWVNTSQRYDIYSKHNWQYGSYF